MAFSQHSAAAVMRNEDGHSLWLRMNKQNVAKVVTKVKTPTASIAKEELQQYAKAGKYILKLDATMADNDGYSISKDAKGNVTIAARRDIGLLYGAYAVLRCQSTGAGNACGNSTPAFNIRILNHWDNLDGSIERGYAGKSIFWTTDDNAPLTRAVGDVKSVIKDYARANASIGINATVLNNVNASPKMLSKDNLLKVKEYADIMRPYGLKVYLSVNFASPMGLGGLPTADPLDKDVQQWWKDKADEIYSLIPDFGGFLVKANSEGQPGPGDYNRTHVQGANMLAEALAPHKGIVMWRAFVYGYHGGEDRVKKAANEFQPLDGQFKDNVIIQIKNGPLDFQPCEPYSPLFDRMKQTPTMVEFQITQEYTGQSRHLVYLAPMWKEFFSFVKPESMSAVAGVANVGNDANWCGHHFSQANWYAFGRLAWNPSLTSEDIAKEWMQQTFSNDASFLNAVGDVMQSSREACVNYMMPLGLHHIFADDHHYGPAPESNHPNFPDEWKPVWYHKADSLGIGFNRSSTGTNAVSQYREPYCSMYDNVKTCPEEYLLWFHHLPWTYQMKDGSTLWESLCKHYDAGVATVDGYVKVWKDMKPYVDDQRYEEVMQRLLHQQENARLWRNHCLGYFSKFSGMKY